MPHRRQPPPPYSVPNPTQKLPQNVHIFPMPPNYIQALSQHFGYPVTHETAMQSWIRSAQHHLNPQQVNAMAQKLGQHQNRVQPQQTVQNVKPPQQIEMVMRQGALQNQHQQTPQNGMENQQMMMMQHIPPQHQHRNALPQGHLQPRLQVSPQHMAIMMHKGATGAPQRPQNGMPPQQKTIILPQAVSQQNGAPGQQVVLSQEQYMMLLRQQSGHQHQQMSQQNISGRQQRPQTGIPNQQMLMQHGVPQRPQMSPQDALMQQQQQQIPQNVAQKRRNQQSVSQQVPAQPGPQQMPQNGHPPNIQLNPQLPMSQEDMSPQQMFQMQLAQQINIQHERLQQQALLQAQQNGQAPASHDARSQQRPMAQREQPIHPKLQQHLQQMIMQQMMQAQLHAGHRRPMEPMHGPHEGLFHRTPEKPDVPLPPPPAIDPAAVQAFYEVFGQVSNHLKVVNNTEDLPTWQLKQIYGLFFKCLKLCQHGEQFHSVDNLPEMSPNEFQECVRYMGTILMRDYASRVPRLIAETQQGMGNGEKGHAEVIRNQEKIQEHQLAESYRRTSNDEIMRAFQAALQASQHEQLAVQEQRDREMRKAEQHMLVASIEEPSMTAEQRKAEEKRLKNNARHREYRRRKKLENEEREKRERGEPLQSMAAMFCNIQHSTILATAMEGMTEYQTRVEHSSHERDPTTSQPSSSSSIPSTSKVPPVPTLLEGSTFMDYMRNTANTQLELSFATPVQPSEPQESEQQPEEAQEYGESVEPVEEQPEQPDKLEQLPNLNNLNMPAKSVPVTNVAEEYVVRSIFDSQPYAGYVQPRASPIPESSIEDQTIQINQVTDENSSRKRDLITEPSTAESFEEDGESPVKRAKLPERSSLQNDVNDLTKEFAFESQDARELLNNTNQTSTSMAPEDPHGSSFDLCRNDSRCIKRERANSQEQEDSSFGKTLSAEEKKALNAKQGQKENPPKKRVNDESGASSSSPTSQTLQCSQHLQSTPVPDVTGRSAIEIVQKENHLALSAGLLSSSIKKESPHKAISDLFIRKTRTAPAQNSDTVTQMPLEKLERVEGVQLADQPSTSEAPPMVPIGPHPFAENMKAQFKWFLLTRAPETRRAWLNIFDQMVQAYNPENPNVPKTKVEFLQHMIKLCDEGII